MGTRGGITISLSISSVENALKELEDYRLRLIRASSLFVEKLAQIGVKAMDEAIASAPASPLASKEHSTEITLVERDNQHVVYSLSLSGANILFIEFGAGVFYNDQALHSSVHPQGVELGYTIGDYGRGQGARNAWSYRDASGQWQTTTGQRASCAIPKAMSEMVDKVLQTAREAWAETRA